MANYQTKFSTLDEAKTEAKEMSTRNTNEEYSIIESVNDDQKVFYVENESPFVRVWETMHGYYSNGKFFKSES